MRGHIALAAGIALACVSSASLAAYIPTDVSAPVPSSYAERFYVSFHGGWVFSSVTHDFATDGGNPPNESKSIAYAKPGYRVGAALGKDVNGNLAVEAEISFAQAAGDHVDLIFPGMATAPLTGSGSSLTGMVNAYLGTDVGALRPYVGAGIGVGYFTAHNIAGFGATLDGSDTGLAAQAMVGVDFAINQDTAIGARYRYVFIDNLSLPDGGFTHSFDIRTQSVDVVLTHTFD
jgi:opacity protein-like surface antigen